MLSVSPGFVRASLVSRLSKNADDRFDVVLSS
jgi:hypothetical protein